MQSFAMNRIACCLLFSALFSSCGKDQPALDNPSVMQQKWIESKDTPREPIPKLVADAKERLMEPYLLAGEDVEALMIRTKIAFHQNSDAELLRELQGVGPDSGYLYHFLEKDAMPERPASEAFIRANEPEKSRLPALNVPE
jgi:hypothetical protein